MPSLTSFLSLAAFSVAGVNAIQAYQAIWSSTEFITFDDESSTSSGFAITDGDGNAWFKTSTVNDYLPCISTNSGRSFTLSSTCWARPRVFHCLADAGGNPMNCDVEDGAGDVQQSFEGDVDNTFIGISTGQDGWCGGLLYLDENESCDENATWTVSDVTEIP